MIRISNSSTENFDRNSLSTVYWIGSFFSKLYRPPCFSYLFSTYANRLIHYSCSLFFFSIIRWLRKAPLEFHHSHSNGWTVPYGCIIIQIYRSWQRLFQQSLTVHWHMRSPISLLPRVMAFQSVGSLYIKRIWLLYSVVKEHSTVFVSLWQSIILNNGLS